MIGRMMSTDEAAEYIGVCPTHLRKLIRNGTIKAINIGVPNSNRATYRIDKNDLDAFVAQREIVGRVNEDKVREWRRRAC